MGIILVYFNPSPQTRLFLRFLPYCFATPRNATGHGKGEVDVRFAAVAVFSTPPSLRATSPIFFVAKHRGGGLMPFCRIILANDMDCISPSPPLQFFIEDRGYSSGLLHSKLICRTLLSPLPVFSNPSVTMCLLPLLYGCATPCKVTGGTAGEENTHKAPKGQNCST